jgi:hypothetical protein
MLLRRSWPVVRVATNQHRSVRTIMQTRLAGAG